MKKFALLLSVAFVAGSVFAQDKPATTETKPATTATKTTSHHHSTKAKAVAGEVVSVDTEKNTITFKNDKGEDLTWPAEGKALASLKTVTSGQKVTIAYTVDAQGAPKAATEIKAVSVKTAPAKAPAPKAPEKK